MLEYLGESLFLISLFVSVTYVGVRGFDRWAARTLARQATALKTHAAE